LEYILYFFIKTILYIITFILNFGIHIQKNNVIPMTSDDNDDILSLIKSSLLPAVMNPLCMKSIFLGD
jgi:hypothetical protein